MARWPFTVDGTGFPIDPTNEQFQGPNSVALMRAQADTSGRPDEGSLNREDYWRRTMTSWHHGAGQSIYDGEDSDPARFSESHGLDVWTEGQISLLPIAEEFVASQYMRRVFVASTGTLEYLFILGTGTGTVIKAFDNQIGTPISGLDITDFTSVTTGTAMKDLATDGVYVYATDDNTGVYRDVPSELMLNGGFPGSAMNTLQCDRLWFLRNRLIATREGSIYNITNPAVTTPPAALYTYPDDTNSWRWNGGAEARGFIYMSGRSGYNSMIYKIGITASDTAALDAPVSAIQWGKGSEYITTIFSTGGFIFIGTNLGVRMATPDAEGYLTYGALIEIGSVTAFTAEGKFVWAGVYQTPTGNNNVQTKLYRLNLDEFIKPLTPAYAEDLVSTAGSGANYPNVQVSSIARFGGRTFYTQAGYFTDASSLYNMLFYESEETLVVEGTMNSGRISFGMTESKVPVEIVVNHYPLTGPGDPIAAQLSLATYFDFAVTPTEFTSTLTAGSTSTTFDPITMEEITVEAPFTDVALELYLRRDNAAQDEGPQVTALNLKARPTPSRSNIYTIPIYIGESVKDLTNTTYKRDPVVDIEFFMDLEDRNVRRDMTLLGHTFRGYVEDHQFGPDGMTRFDRNFRGVMLIRVREVN